MIFRALTLYKTQKLMLMHFVALKPTYLLSAVLPFQKTTQILSVLESSSSCDDNSQYASSCPGWAGKGYCTHSYVSWMSANCKKSCGLCCTATDNSQYASSCPGWKEKGYCSHSYVSWMMSNCKKTCTC